MKTKTYEIDENRVLKYNRKKEVITICDKKTGKEAVFTPARWASFRLYEVDAQLNSLSQDRDVAYCAHYGGGWHVSVTTGYRCVDLRKWYVPFGKTDRKATRTGIALRLSAWFAFKQTVQHLHRDYPDVVNYTACFLAHPQDQVTCMECNPYPILSNYAWL